MKAKLHPLASFELLISRDELQTLLECSSLHYDGVCRSASVVGGFLYGWNIHMIYSHEEGSTPLTEVTVLAIWTQLDTCLKILEMPPSHLAKSARDLSIAFGHYMRESTRVLSSLNWEL